MQLEEIKSSEWHDCGPVQLQGDHLYDMEWSDPQLENMRVAAAAYGGPIAVIRDSRKMVLVRGGPAQPTVRIFNCAGRETARFIWNGGSIVGMGWAASQQLLLVDTFGEIAMYDVHGQRTPSEYSLGATVLQEKLYNCLIYDEGIVGITYENSIWAITDLNDVRSQRLADIEAPSNPQCMALRISKAHGVEVVLACEEMVITVDTYESHSQELEIGFITMMAVSPNNELIMVYTQSDTLVVLSSDLAKLLTFEPPTDSPPLQIAWCANDLLVMSFEGALILVEADGEWTNFSVDGSFHLVTELDCLRVITEKVHVLIRKVSASTLNVLSTQSDHPGRDLYLARHAYDAQDAESDMILRNVRDDLMIAVHACIEVAGEQIDVPRQRDLLKAATYGVAFCPGFPNTKLYETCRRLRILNNVRDPQVGIPMTMNQLEEQGISALISRLIHGHQHLLASKICESMGMNQDAVLRHWACARITADNRATEDEDLKAVIVDKLIGCKGVKYATIAEHAQTEGRMNLARLLLEYEVVAADQVPLLLKLGDERRGLRCAIESGDTDLVYYTLFYLYRKLALSDKLEDFYYIVLSERQAADLFIKHCKYRNRDIGREMYRLRGSLDGEASICFDNALSVGLKIPEDPSGEEGITVGNMREQVVNLLKESATIYGKTKKHDFQSKTCEEFAQLRKLQAHVDGAMGRNVLVGLSVVDSIKQCIRLSNQKAAEDFKKAFGITDKHFWWIVVGTLAEKGDWEMLETFAASKRSPIGWEPFIQSAMRHNAPSERLEKLIARLPDSEEKVEYYAKAGLNLSAAKTAANIQNDDLLTKIHGMMGTNTQLGLLTATMIERLRGQGDGPSTS